MSSTAMGMGNRTHSVKISYCKQTKFTITLPRIPEGVIVLPNIVGCVEKLQYSSHDVVDKDNFKNWIHRYTWKENGLV
jgi:hypothetical protein